MQKAFLKKVEAKQRLEEVNGELDTDGGVRSWFWGRCRYKGPEVQQGGRWGWSSVNPATLRDEVGEARCSGVHL